MKMVKKVLLGLAAGALVLGLAGCKGITVGGDDSVDGEVINGTTAKAYVGDKDGEGYTNETGDYVREMQLFSTKHYGAFAALTLTDENKNSNDGNGQLGYVFNYTENDDETVNFITIGYRWYNKQLQTYVSQYYNVKKSDFKNDNFGAPKKSTIKEKDSTKTTAYEIIVEDFNTLTTSKFGTLSDDGSATIGVEVIAEEDGSYTVNYYGSEKLDNYKLKKDQEADKTVTIDKKVTGYTKKTQTKIGCYVNVYSGKTLNGFWRFSSIKGEDLPVEGFED